MGDKQQPRGRDGRFLPAGARVQVRTPDGKSRTYRATDATAARIAQQVKRPQPPASGAR